MKIQTDCYGYPYTSEYFKVKKKETYLLKGVEGVMYECFDGGSKRAIHRIDTAPDGSLRVMWAWGSWDDCENLAYVPVNETLDAEREDE